ncbi:BRCT domain-containing protein [Strongyloides ratti]|uniref:BRCT domain-containing protein n=1 Tax=Strongyloides ratti TaxID=34506 RepID=A0A090LGV2_STRRB|nr:BRCT domain-containing protein [Strongyloides ratti]CEF67358.1 BRCT domain-containing protein [Strongyloides ratti]
MEGKFEKLDLIIDKLKIKKYKKFVKVSEKEIKKYTEQELIQEDNYICDGYNFVQYYNNKNYKFDRRIVFYINLSNPDSLQLIKKSGYCVEYTTFLNEAIFHPICKSLWKRTKYFEDISILESLSSGRRIITYDNVHTSYLRNEPNLLYLLSHFIDQSTFFFDNLSFLVDKSFFNNDVSENFFIKLINILRNFGAIVYHRKAQLYDNKNVIVLTDLSSSKIDDNVKTFYDVKIAHINLVYDSIWHKKVVDMDPYLL